ncbi:hypothetical protein [Gordonia soli]|nr:hypothetical protein [Gordonia soli]
MVPWLSDRLAEAHLKQTALAQVPQPPRPAPPNPDDEESPVPFNRGAAAHFDELRTVVMRWVRDYCDQLGVEFFPVDAVPADFIGPLPKFGRWREGRYVRDHRDRWRMTPGYVPTTRDLARWLRRHHLEIANSEDAVLCAQEIDNAVRKMLREINPRRLVFCGPCPTVTGTTPRGEPKKCEQAIWAEWDDEHDRVQPHAQCWRCRATHDVAVLRQNIFARADNFLLTEAELFNVLDDLGEHLPRVKFYAWKRERRIRPRGWKHKGRITNFFIQRGDPAVYELAEVRGLMAADEVGASA